MDDKRRLSLALLPASVIIEEEEPDAVEAPLRPQEEPVVARAVAKRRQDFSAGRSLARRALQGAGFAGAADFAILQDEQRAPIWPEGFTGSITHTKGRVAAAAARTSDFRGLGLDVERDTPLADGVGRRVLTAQDDAMLATLPEEERAFAGKLIFSAKECAYKCQYSVTQTYLGFDAMWIELQLARGAFVAHFRREVGEFTAEARLDGRFARADGLVMTAVSHR